jgi:hypothetical protein
MASNDGTLVEETRLMSGCRDSPPIGVPHLMTNCRSGRATMLANELLA